MKSSLFFIPILHYNYQIQDHVLILIVISRTSSIKTPCFSDVISHLTTLPFLIAAIYQASNFIIGVTFSFDPQFGIFLGVISSHVQSIVNPGLAYFYYCISITYSCIHCLVNITSNNCDISLKPLFKISLATNNSFILYLFTLFHA